MSYNFQYFDSHGSATSSGVFIPVDSLPGVLSTELSTFVSAAAKNGKVLLALLNRIFNILSPTSFRKLGFTVAKSAPAGVAPDIFNQSFTFTWQKLINLDDNTITQIPVPSSGANDGEGDFCIVDVFPGASIVSVGASVSEPGVLIPFTAITPNSSISDADLLVNSDTDNREWLMALMDHLAIDAEVRSSTNRSAIIAATASPIGAAAIPANFTQATDPVSGIAAADLQRRGLITRTLGYTVQVVVDQTTQTFDVNVA